MMDLETENRIASMLLKEAAELRRQVDEEGVLAYLKKPTVRARPNSRFLTSTVRGVEQANRAVEVNEMWRLRQKEKELDNKIRYRVRDGNEHVVSNYSMSRSHRHEPGNRRHDMPSSSNTDKEDDRYRPDDEGLKDDEIDEFLRSRVKRGRGAVGSRMDEMGPYVSQSSNPHDDPLVESDHGREERWSRMALGPDKPSWKLNESSDDDDDDDDESDDKRKKSKKSSSGSSKKHHCKKHKSNEKTRDKKRKKSRHDKRYS